MPPPWRPRQAARSAQVCSLTDDTQPSLSPQAFAADSAGTAKQSLGRAGGTRHTGPDGSGHDGLHVGAALRRPCGLPAESRSATVAAAQRFCQLGARFSAKARGPSLASSLLKTSPEISDSIR